MISRHYEVHKNVKYIHMSQMCCEFLVAVLKGSGAYLASFGPIRPNKCPNECEKWIIDIKRVF